jgi:hypothetical protein
MKLRLLVTVFAVIASLTGCVSTTAKQAPSGPPSVSFTEPIDGAAVSGKFQVKFAVSGMEVKPAGDMTPNTGHFHLLINKPGVKQGESIAFLDQQEIHFSQGQTETPLFLLPGRHQLTVQFANGAHESYGVAMSRTINITVK